MAVSKEFIQKMAEELGYKFSPFTSHGWVRIEKDGKERKFKGYQPAYNYLYRQRRKLKPKIYKCSYCGSEINENDEHMIMEESVLGIMPSQEIGRVCMSCYNAEMEDE